MLFAVDMSPWTGEVSRLSLVDTGCQLGGNNSGPGGTEQLSSAGEDTKGRVGGV